MLRLSPLSLVELGLVIIVSKSDMPRQEFLILMKIQLFLRFKHGWTLIVHRLDPYMEELCWLLMVGTLEMSILTIQFKSVLMEESIASIASFRPPVQHWSLAELIQTSNQEKMRKKHKWLSSLKFQRKLIVPQNFEHGPTLIKFLFLRVSHLHSIHQLFNG